MVAPMFSVFKTETKGTNKTLGGEIRSYYHDFGDSIMSVCICPNSSNGMD